MKGSFVPLVGTTDPFARSVARDLRSVLQSTGYTVDGLDELAGPGALAPLENGDELRARLALTEVFGADADLVRLFAFGDDVDPARTLVPAGLAVDDLVAVGLLGSGRASGSVCALVRLLPHQVAGRPSWLLADRPRRPLPSDHVLGLGGAARSLIDLQAPGPAESVLDLGTGSGVQLLHLAGLGRQLVGTDINPRALSMASWSLALSEVEAELVLGDRYAPIGERRFGLIVSNPPFVVEPGSDATYRSSGSAQLEGDAMTAAIVSRSRDHLIEGGRAQVIGNWLHVGGDDWRERVAGWLPAGLDAWVIQREVLAPDEYVRAWLDDEGRDDPIARLRRYDEWLSWFEDRGIEAVGLGWINLQDAGGAFGVRRLETLRQPLERPFGDVVERTLSAWRSMDTLTDADLLDCRPRLAQGVVLEQSAVGGDSGWSQEQPALVQTRGVGRRADIDGFGVAVPGLLNGRRTVREAVEAAAGLAEIPAQAVLEAALEAIGGLVQDGFVDL